MYEENEISLKELIMVLIKEKKLILFLTFGATFIALIVTLLLPSTFEAQSQLVFTIPKSYESRFGLYEFPSQNVADYLPLLDSMDLKNEVNSELQIEGFNSSYVYNKDYKYVIVKTQASTPELAKEVNDTLVRSYINRINAQFKLIAIDKFINEHQLNIRNLNFKKSKNQSMLDEKTAFIELLKPVYTLQRAVFSDPKTAALYADKFNLDLSSISDNVVLEEFANQKYMQIDAEIIDLKTSLIDMNESIKFSQILLDELLLEKKDFESKLKALDYADDLKDELTVLQGGISQVSTAALPKNKISPRSSLNVVIGFVLGLMSAVFIAFFKHYWMSEK